MNLELKAVKIYKYTISFLSCSLSFQRFNKSCEKWRLYSFIILLCLQHLQYFIFYLYVLLGRIEKTN